MDSLKFPWEHNLVPRVLFPPKPGKSTLGMRLMGAIATSSNQFTETGSTCSIGHSDWDLTQGFLEAKFLLNTRICHISTGQSISVSWWLPPFWRHSLLIQSINRIHPFCKYGREQNAWWEEIGWTLWCLCIQINWSLYSKYICDTWMYVSNQSLYRSLCLLVRASDR